MTEAPFIEGHVYVPLASIFRPYWWLLLWAWLGVRKDSQRGWTPEKAARHNYQYLTNLNHANVHPRACGGNLGIYSR